MKGTVLITPTGVCTCDAPWIRECKCWFSTYWKEAKGVEAELAKWDVVFWDEAPGIPISDLKAKAYTPTDNA